jgi:CelD/BcsL family acetyltransferase involved in cellulose biosynthesis
MIGLGLSVAEVVNPLAEPGWDEAISGTVGAVFQSRRWLEVLADTYGFDFRASVELDQHGRITGALPFCRINDLRGERLVVLPFSDFTAPLLRDQHQWGHLIAPLIHHGIPITIQTTNNPILAADDRFRLDRSSVRQVVPLSEDIDVLFDRFRPQARRHVHRARREGLVFREAQSLSELRAFYDLHLGVRKSRHGLLCQPYRLFEAIWERFVLEETGTLILGFDGEAVVSGCLLLEDQGTLYYKYAASHPDYRSAGASHGAVFAAMEYGIRRGLSTLDLGRSDVDQPGLIDFKRRFGAKRSELHRYVSVGQPLCERDGVDETLTELTRLFVTTEVPNHVTERAGDLLYRYFA